MDLLLGTTNTPYVPPTESQLEWIRRKKKTCDHRAGIHNDARLRFHAMDVSSIATVITLSTVSSAFSLLGDACKDGYIKILTGTINLTITGLTSWYGFHKYGERKRKHERTRNAYTELARKLEAEMTLYETEEQHFRTAGSFIREIRNQIDRIESESPNLPSNLEKRYKEEDEDEKEGSEENV